MRGSELRERRLRHEMTQAQAAAIMRVHRVTVANWERRDLEVERKSAALWDAYELMPKPRQPLMLRAALLEAHQYGEQMAERT